MIAQDDALTAAAEFLDGVGYGAEFTVVMQPELTEEHPTAWAVRFDSQEHLDTGNPTKAPFCRVVIVPKDGGAPHFPPSHLPVAEYLASGD